MTGAVLRPVVVLRVVEHSMTPARFPEMKPTRFLKKLFPDGADLLYKAI